MMIAALKFAFAILVACFFGLALAILADDDHYDDSPETREWRRW